MTPKIAIIGSGPTGIYTLKGLVGSRKPLSVTIFEIEADAGLGLGQGEDRGRAAGAQISADGDVAPDVAGPPGLDRAVMLLTGSADLAALRKAPRLLGAELRLWTSAR